MRYTVRSILPGAPEVEEQVLEAASAAELEQRLKATGRIVLALRTVVAAQTGRVAGRIDVVWWCRELQTLLRAGMSPVEAIDTVAAASTDGDRGMVHRTLLNGIGQGLPLSAAMRRCGVFPDMLVSGVAASERNSTLAEALGDYLRYAELLRALRGKAVAAAIYPGLVVGVGVAIAIFLLLFVVPRFAPMYATFHGDLSLLTGLVISASRLLAEQRALVMWGLAAAVAALLLLARTTALRQAAALAVESLPALRRRLDEYRLAKLYQSLALLLRGGYAVDEALGLCSGLSLGRRIHDGVDRARQGIARGQPVSAAMSEARLADVTAERLMAVGERSGDFDRVLQAIADRHAAAFAATIERATRLLEPLLLLLVAATVGGLVVMLYMPIFDIAGATGAAR